MATLPAPTALRLAVTPADITRVLREFGLTQTMIAAATGVSDRAVRGWDSGGIRRDNYDHLAELQDLVLLLAQTLTPDGVGQWLNARLRLLRNQRPIELIAEGQMAEVRAAAEAFVAGDYV